MAVACEICKAGLDIHEDAGYGYASAQELPTHLCDRCRKNVSSGIRKIVECLKRSNEVVRADSSNG